MTIELAITDETPEPAPGLSDQDILDSFLATPMQGSYREYLLKAGRAIEAKALQPLATVCGNCDTAVPPGCGGVFKDDGAPCVLNGREA